MRPSENIINYIKDTETFQAKEYDDRGVGSVGYGIRGSGKKSVTPAEAERDFLARISIAEQELKKVITRPGMTQNKWDALYDMHYNMGLTKMRDQGFIDLINKGTDEEVANSIRNANKSRHSTTGEVEELPTLSKRAAHRASLWLGDQGNSEAAFDLSVLDQDAVDLAVLDQPSLEEVDLSILDEADIPRNLEGSLTQNLNSAVELPDEQEKSALKLAKEFNRPIEDMRAEMVDSTYDDVRVKLKTSDIVEGSPKTAEYAASSPERANLLKKTKDYLPRIESVAKQLNKEDKGMIEKVVNTNRAIISKGFTYLGMVTGALGPNEGIANLEALSIEQQDNVINTPEMQEITKVMEKMTPVMKKALGEVTKSWDSTKAPYENILPSLAAVADNTPEFAEALWNITASLITNPGTATALVAQTQLPMVAGAAAGTVGTLAAGPVAGGRAAWMTAGSLSGVMSFTEYMDRQLEEFREPSTGLVNYGLAFSDPKRVAQWRNEAALYSGVMAVSDAMFQKGGDFFVKHFMKAGTGVKGAAKAAGSTMATGAVSEGGSQFLALQATDIYGDRVTTERTAENLAEGATEGIVGMFAAGATSAISIGTAKTVDAIKKSNTANEDVAAASELREEFKKDEAYQSAAQDVDDFVDSVINVSPREEADADTDLDAKAPSMEQAIEVEASSNVVALTPSEFEKFSELKGINPMEVLGAFSPRTQAEYARNRNSDSSVAIPIAEFLRATEEIPELDGLVRFNGNELNALEANETIERIEQDPFVLFDRTVFHGSPFKFDKFKETAINSGEGAQAYGYGLYFSEDHGVAEWYRKKLTSDGNQFSKPLVTVMVKYDLFGFDTTAEAISAFSQEPDWENVWDAKGLTSEEKYVIYKELEDIKKPEENKGQVFEVKLPDGLWMDLEATLNSIPPENVKDLREAISKVAKEDKKESPSWTEVETSMPKSEVLKSFIKGEKLNEDFVTVGQILSSLSSKEDRDLAPLLAAKGYNGFVYKGIESGKRNFVVFSEDDAKIVKTFYDQDLPELPTSETPAQEVGGAQIFEADETTVPGSDLVSRPIQLTHQFRNLGEREAYNTLRNKLTRATFKDTVDQQALDLIADVQFRQMRARADLLGVPVTDVVDKVKFRKARAGENVRGLFIPANIENDFHTVAFTKNADAKTVLHELSHLWLYELAEDASIVNAIPEAQRNSAQTDYAKAMGEAASLLGLENINDLLTLGEADQRKLQEIFANTSEKYFSEGKFENSKLRHLFESLRKWIVSAARPLRNLVNTYPTLKLDGRFEFVMDTILGASDKIDDALYPMFDDPMFSKEDLGAPEFKAYQDKLLEARSEAQAQAYSKVFTNNMRARERQLDNSLNQLYDEAVATVEESMSQRMASQFQKAYASRQQGDMENRLSFESIRDVLANGSEVDAETIKKNVPTYMMTGKKKGGIDVSLLMQMQGINDPAVMLDLLLETGRKDQLIEQEFQRLVKDFDHGLKTDQEIHEVAVEAVNNKGRERLILDEFNILAAKNPQALRRLGAFIANAASSSTQDLAKILKASAEANIPEANAFKFSPTRYLNDMMRARRQASRAFKRGDIESAIKSKQIESQQYFNYKEAQSLKPQLARSLKRIGKLFNDYSSLSRQPFYDRQVMEFGVRTAIAAREGNFSAIQPLNADEISDISPIGQDGIRAINAALAQFVSASNGRLGDSTSVGAMISLGDFTKTVMHQAREARLVRINGKTEEVAGLANNILLEVGEGSSINTFNTDRSFLEGYFSSTTNVRTMLESMYASKEDFVNGVFSQLMEGIERGETARNLDVTKYTNEIVEALRKVAKADTKLQALYAPILNRIPGKASIDKTARPIASSELDHTFNNISEVLTMLLIMGSESGAKKLILGRKWGSLDINGNVDKSKVNAFIDRAVDQGILTEDHINFVNKVFEVMEEIYPMVAQAMHEVDGVTIGKIDPVPYETKAGKIKGGYFPLTRALGVDANGKPIGVRASTTDFTDLMSADTFNTDAHKLFPIQNKNLTKHRDDSIYEVDLALDKVIPYVSAALNIAHLRAPLKDFGKVMNHPTTRQVLEARRPGAIDTMINPWFTRVLRQEYTVYSDNVINGAARFIRTRANVAMYFGAVTSSARQFLGLAPVMHELGVSGPARVSWAMTKFGTAPLKAPAEVSKKSMYMNGRREGSQKAFMRSFDELSTNFDWISDSTKWTQDKAFALIQFTQNIVDTITWMAAYDSALAKDLNEDRAVAYADNIVKSTQSDPSVSEMPAIMAGNDTHKLLTSVMTQVMAMHNLVRAETMRDQSLARKLGLATSFAMVGLTIPGFLDALLSELAFPVPEEEEEKNPVKTEEERAKRVMARSMGQVIDTGFPIVGRFAMGLISNDTVTFSPTIARATRALEGTAKATGAMRKDQELTPYEFSALMDFFTFASGLPLSKLGDLNKIEYDNLEPWERRALKKERAKKRKIYERENR